MGVWSGKKSSILFYYPIFRLYWNTLDRKSIQLSENILWTLGWIYKFSSKYNMEFRLLGFIRSSENYTECRLLLSYWTKDFLEGARILYNFTALKFITPHSEKKQQFSMSQCYNLMDGPTHWWQCLYDKPRDIEYSITLQSKGRKQPLPNKKFHGRSKGGI